MDVYFEISYWVLFAGKLIFNPYLQITEDLKRVKRFDAQEALDYGLIDRIVRPRRIKADAPRKDAGLGIG